MNFLCCTPQTDTALCINYISIKLKRKNQCTLYTFHIIDFFVYRWLRGSLFLRGLFSCCGRGCYPSLQCVGITVVASFVTECGLQRAPASVLGNRGSIVAVSRLSSTGLVIVVLGFSWSEACGIFLDQGLNLSPALAGWFFTSQPPGKIFLYYFSYFRISSIFSSFLFPLTNVLIFFFLFREVLNLYKLSVVTFFEFIISKHFFLVPFSCLML